MSLPKRSECIDHLMSSFVGDDRTGGGVHKVSLGWDREGQKSHVNVGETLSTRQEDPPKPMGSYDTRSFELGKWPNSLCEI